jgi:hypothetical protein
VTLVMGMDQHRAQISAEWIDTFTGEISTARIAPADRATVRRFLARFDGSDLEPGSPSSRGRPEQRRTGYASGPGRSRGRRIVLLAEPVSATYLG